MNPVSVPNPEPRIRQTPSLSGGVVGPQSLSGARLSSSDFAERFTECWRVLWCTAVSAVRDRSLAQDVVQQAAVIGLQNLGDFQPGTNFVAWMVQIVRNISRNETRLRHRRQTDPTDPSSLDAGASRRTEAETTSSAAIDGRGRLEADQAEFDDTMTQALDSLDETARACLLMRVVLDLPYRQIALALDIPEGTAASHVHRARAAMRSRLVAHRDRRELSSPAEGRA